MNSRTPASPRAPIGSLRSLWPFMRRHLGLFVAWLLALVCSSTATLSLPIAGTNLAVWYGFGLIAAAFVLALVYGVLCRSRETDRTEDAK